MYLKKDPIINNDCTVILIIKILWNLILSINREKKSLLKIREYIFEEIIGMKSSTMIIEK